MTRIHRARLSRHAFVALVIASSLAALVGCGSEENTGSDESAHPDAATAGDERPTLDAELAKIDAAKLSGLSEDQCEDVLTLISIREPGWLEEVNSLNVDIDIISRSTDEVAARFERWLENAREDAAAREAVEADDGDSFAKEQDLAYANPLGLNGSERAERQHEDAWIRLWLLRSCETQIEEMGTGAGYYVLDTDWPSLPSNPPDDSAAEGAAIDPDVVSWATQVVEEVATSGLSTAYQRFGSSACKALVSDPLVAHMLDVIARHPAAVEDDSSEYRAAIGAWLYGADEPASARIVIRRIVSGPDSDDDLSLALRSAIPIVESGEGFQLDDAACLATS